MRASVSSLLLVCCFVLALGSVVYCDFPATLQLERAFSLSHRVELDELRARDRVRHARILQSGVGGVVDFSVSGSSDPFFGFGLYFTKVRLGSPPREFNVQIDTGSDTLWVTCNSCTDCPRSSALGIQLNFFDSAGSSTAALVSCSDPMCNSAFQSTATQCLSQSNQCSYSFQYGDGSGTAGHYVSDLLYFDMILGRSTIANSSATIVFGCSTYQSGDLTKTDKAVDGIFGFGQGDLSVISQLSSRGITPKVFSHCLKGQGDGGGILVLGEILEPSIVYSPLVPSQPHYNLYLQSIAVNGQLLPIDAAVFATANNRGTIVDSGTTLAYFVEEVYNQLINSITASVPSYVTPIISKGYQCYLVSTSVSQIFPQISLNFAGGASMYIKPEEYLIHLGPYEGKPIWCIGFQKAQERVTILGDIILKDKIFVYDLARQQIGWANYDCSTSVNVSVTSGKDEFINAGQLTSSSSSMEKLSNLLLLLPMATVTGLLMHITAFSPSHFL